MNDAALVDDRDVLAQLLRLFQYAIGSATKIDERFTFHKVEVTHAALDTQHQMHMDTFSSITKVFGFAQAVTLKDGPFHYVKGSHRHSTKKLKLIKRLVDDDEFAASQPSSSPLASMVHSLM